jgi:tetratricopeptide (TPR) repeat protein
MKVARVHIKLGRALASYPGTSDITKALEHLRGAERILGSTPAPRLAGPLALGLAAASMWWADPSTASAHARRGMDIGREQGSESIWATGAAFEGWALGLRGRFDESRDLFERAWTVADRLDNVLAAFTASWAKTYGYHGGDPREHARLALRELDKPRQAQAGQARESLRGTVAAALAYAGDMNRARSLTSEFFYIPAGPMYFADSFEEEERRLIDQVERTRAQGLRWVEGVQAGAMLGPIQWARGDVDRARANFHSAIEILGGRCLTDEYAARTRLAILEAWDGHVSEAAKHLSRCDEILAQGNGWRGFLGMVGMAKASVAAARGRLGEAESLFAEAIEVFRKYGLPFAEAETLHLWGRALFEIDPKRALEKYDAALEIYTTREIGRAWIDRVLTDRERAG